MEIALAEKSDYGRILDLQSRCFIGNLPLDARADGFLSAEFSVEQIHAMASGLGIVVARDAGSAVAYMCASRLDQQPRPPILDAMFACLEEKVFRGKALTEGFAFVYGPVCIEQEYRGTGLLRRMFSTLKRSLSGRFEFGMAFVAADNPRSLKAHIDGLGMTSVGTFEHDGNLYHALTFSTV